MANHEFEKQCEADEGWVEARIALLAPAREAVPNAGMALNRLWSRHRARGAAIRRWLWTTTVATIAGIAVLVVPASRACAEQPGACVQRMLGVAPAQKASATEKAPVLMAAVEPGSATGTVKHDRAVAVVAPGPPVRGNFKSEGAAGAAVSLEIYIDYDCVHCENFVREVLPELRRQFVATGEVRLVWRDFPMPNHRFARLAARYADAAGALGYYGAAMEQIFASREEWDVSGDVDAEVAKVLPAAAMVQVRQHLQTDATVDEGIEVDRAAGQADHVNFTPFAVIVRDGKREAITEGLVSFEAVKSRIVSGSGGLTGR